MVSVDKDKKTSAEKAVEAKPASEGPHTFRGRKNVKENTTSEDPPYVVSVKASAPEEGEGEKGKLFYTPQELRAKARSMLASGKLTKEEKNVLNEILGPQNEDNKAKSKS